MTDDESRQLKAALLKCADEHENELTFTGYVVISSICRAARERIEELEWQVADLGHDKKMLEEGYVYEDYDPGEGCYEDEHKGKWVKKLNCERGEVKSELERIMDASYWKDTKSEACDWFCSELEKLIERL